MSIILTIALLPILLCATVFDIRIACKSLYSKTLGRLDNEFVGVRAEVDYQVGYIPKMNDVNWVNRTNSKYDLVTTSFRISILPRRCHYSKKFLWLKKSYRVRVSTLNYGGEIYDDDRWYDKHEYIRLRLLG